MTTSGRKVRITRTTSDNTLSLVPNLERLAIILGVTEINGAGEELLAAINAPGSEQFLRADDAKFLAELRPEHILAAVAASDREIGGAVVAAAS